MRPIPAGALVALLACVSCGSEPDSGDAGGGNCEAVGEVTGEVELTVGGGTGRSTVEDDRTTYTWDSGTGPVRLLIGSGVSTDGALMAVFTGPDSSHYEPDVQTGLVASADGTSATVDADFVRNEDGLANRYHVVHVAAELACSAP